MISSKKYVDETLKKHNLVANKALGQNFLVEDNIASLIVSSVKLDSSTCVIEIGPGLGALSEFILEKVGLLKAFEIDNNMVMILKETFKEKENFDLTNIDFLKVDIEELVTSVKNKGFKRIVFMSNLPYYITSKLLNKILVNNYEIDDIVVMMQKEVGLKLLRPDKKEYNVLSTILDYQYESNVVTYVGKNSYLPRPEIDSIVLKFSKINPRFAVDFASFIKTSTALFAQRRKTALNNLKAINKDAEEILKKCGIEPSTHIEQLSIKDIALISLEISKL